MSISRTRSKDNTSLFDTVTAITSQTNSVGAKSCVSGTASLGLAFPYALGRKELMHDMIVPGYSRLSAKGGIFNNPMAKYSSEVDLTVSSRSYYVPYAPSVPSTSRYCAYAYAQQLANDVSGLNAAGGTAGHLSINSINVASLRDLAGTQALAGVDEPVFEGAKFIAELRETIGFLTNPLGTFVRKLEGYRKTKRARKYLNHMTTGEFISSNWLRYRYAIRPIVHDIESAAQAVAQTVHGHTPERKTSRGSASDSSSQSNSGVIDSFFDQDTVTDHTVSVRAGVLYQYIRDPSTFGVGVPFIAGAVWEAIPFSFVADWFFNIGSFIDAASPRGGVKRLASWTTTKVESNTTREIWCARGGSINGQPRVIQSDGRSRESVRTTALTRVPGISIGITSRISPLSGDIGKKRIADLVALGERILLSK